MEMFSALLAICAGNSPVPGEIPTQRPVTRSFEVFFDLRLNKRLSKQSWGWWFEMPSRPLWRHRNDKYNDNQAIILYAHSSLLYFLSTWCIFCHLYGTPSYPDICISKDVLKSTNSSELQFPFAVYTYPLAHCNAMTTTQTIVLLNIRAADFFNVTQRHTRKIVNISTSLLG